MLTPILRVAERAVSRSWLRGVAAPDVGHSVEAELHRLGMRLDVRELSRHAHGSGAGRVLDTAGDADARRHRTR